MYNLLLENKVGYQASQRGPDWANYPLADVGGTGNGLYSHCQGYWSNNPNYAIAIGELSLSSAGYFSSNVVDPRAGWRARLELVL